MQLKNIIFAANTFFIKKTYITAKELYRGNACGKALFYSLW